VIRSWGDSMSRVRTCQGSGEYGIATGKGPTSRVGSIWERSTSRVLIRSKQRIIDHFVAFV
jgi:hypothetical protein